VRQRIPTNLSTKLTNALSSIKKYSATVILMIMKPYKTIRGDEGYCCEWDDGPYKDFKRKHRRTKKRADKNLVKEELSKELASVAKKVKV